jgi:hypothetical protein
MAYDRKELIRLLKQNGFYIKRRTKHEQWWDGLTRITMPTGNGFDGRRLGRMIHLQIENAIKKRMPEKV